MGAIARIDFSDCSDLDRWQTFIYSRPDTHCSDLGQWRLLFKELYRFDNYTYAWQEHGAITAAISVYHIPSPFMGNMLVSAPFFGYGGLYADDPSVADRLIAEVERKAEELNVDYIELRLTKKLPEPYRANTSFLEFNLDLKASAEDIWKRRLCSNARQNIRKSRRHPLRFEVSGEGSKAYRLLSRTLRSHGTPFHGKEFFRLLAEHLKDSVRFSLVYLGARPVAAGILLRFKDRLLTPYIGSLRKYRSLEANYCQYWNIIGYCLKRGIATFELGRSPKHSTHAQFKEKWGGQRMNVYYNYHIVRQGGRYQSVNEPKKIFLAATRLWRHMPLCLTRSLGHRFFRHIP